MCKHLFRLTTLTAIGGCEHPAMYDLGICDTVSRMVKKVSSLGLVTRRQAVPSRSEDHSDFRCAVMNHQVS